MDLLAPTRARLRAGDLAVFADLRARSDLFVLPLAEAVWLRWQGDADIVCRLLSLAEVELFERAGSRWVPAGRTLAVEGVPDDRHPGWKPLSAVLLPGRVEPDVVVPSPVPRVELRLVPGGQPVPARGLAVSLAALLAWSDGVPESELRRLRGVWREDEAFVLGDSLPAIGQGRRDSGERVLLPLGWGCEPALSEAALAEALGLAAGEIARISPEGVDVFAASAFVSLTRVGLRRLATS